MAFKRACVLRLEHWGKWCATWADDVGRESQVNYIALMVMEQIRTAVTTDDHHVRMFGRIITHHS